MTNPEHQPREGEGLKPCPFCGSAAEIERDSDHHGGWFNLGCSRHWGTHPEEDRCVAGRLWYTESELPEAEAIAAWNRRTPTTRPGVEEIARVIAGYIAGDYDTLYEDKRDWTNDRGARHDINTPYKSDLREVAIAVLALLPDAPAPVGWKLVPVEPDVGMIAAWYRIKNGHHFHDEPPPADTSDYAAYRAMIAAAPTPEGRALSHPGEQPPNKGKG